MSTGNDNNSPATVIYDDTCGLCFRSMSIIRARDRRGRFRLVPRASVAGRDLLHKYGLEEIAETSVIVLTRGQSLSKSAAILYILQRLGGLRPIATMLAVIPRKIRDFLYDFVAARRYTWFRRCPGCRAETRRDETS